MEAIRVAPQSPAPLLRAGAAMCARKSVCPPLHTHTCPSFPGDGATAEILRVVYNLQPVAFPEGQVGRRPRLVVVQRHKRGHASCRRRTIGGGGRGEALKKSFGATFTFNKPDFTAVPSLDDCNILDLTSAPPLPR